MYFDSACSLDGNQSLSFEPACADFGCPCKTSCGTKHAVEGDRSVACTDGHDYLEWNERKVGSKMGMVGRTTAEEYMSKALFLAACTSLRVFLCPVFVRGGRIGGGDVWVDIGRHERWTDFSKSDLGDNERHGTSNVGLN